MAVQIQVRRDTAAAWTAANPILAQGEIGYERDTNKFKIGDGLTAWNSISTYFAASNPVAAWGAITGTLSNQTDLNTALGLKAPLASPALTGTPTAPTAAAATNTTQIATTAFVRAEVANVVASSPAALDTLNELAAALGNDASFSTTVTNALAGKLAIASNLSDLNNAATARTNLGLGNVSNTSDANKPVSTAQQTALDLKADKTPTVNAQTGTSYTLVAGDNGKVITCSNASAITVTVPSGLGAGFNCLIVQLGAGQVTLSPSSVTLLNRQSQLKTAGQYATVSILSHVANSFIVGGDTAA